jgi:hypothetical protein
MRPNGLPRPPTQTRRGAYPVRFVPVIFVPVIVACVAAVLVLTGCSGARTPTDSSGTGPTITPTTTAPARGASPTGPTPSPSVPSGAAQGTSGVAGTTVTSRCPVVTDPPCPTNPVTTHVVVTNAGGTVAAVDTGADGRFRIALRPGVYTIEATAVPKGISRPATTTVTVVAGHFLSLTLDIDSGIR